MRISVRSTDYFERVIRSFVWSKSKRKENYYYYYYYYYYFSPRMLQSVCMAFSSSGVGVVNSMQGIRPATYPLLVLSQCLCKEN
jgi:hypothetical protein